MIFKNFETSKIDLMKYNFFLFYGKNDDLKKEKITYFANKISDKETFNYYEKEIFENKSTFYENILSVSFFTKKKIIIINQGTDKILNIVEELVLKRLNDVYFIINSENLDKKSKLRLFFEKEKNLACVAFYPDTAETLIKIASDSFKKFNIPVSNENLNMLVLRSNGNRLFLQNELEKIEIYLNNKKDINKEILNKLTNLGENYSIPELIDNCLCKNLKKTVNILNENTFTSEDAIIIIRTFLQKAKKIFKLAAAFELNKDLEMTINSAKPPIFWKDKDFIKQQITKWKPKQIKNLIFELNDLEYLSKKDYLNSIRFISDFLLSKALN